MTAESTVPSPGGQPREHGFSPVSVIPPREAADGFRFPAGRRTSVRRTARWPLPAVDAGAALLASLALTGAQRHPLLDVQPGLDGAVLQQLAVGRGVPGEG
ncbi:transferase, partial [Streptomyces sp. NPDC005568]